MPLTKTLKALNAKRAIIDYITAMRESDNIADLDRCEKGAIESAMAHEATKGTLVDVLCAVYVNSWTSTDPGTPGDLMRLKKARLVTCLCNVIMDIGADEIKDIKANAELDLQATITEQTKPTTTEHTLTKDTKEAPTLKENPKRGMYKCTPAMLELFQAVVYNPKQHSIAPGVARMVPSQNSLHIKRSILDLCGIKYTDPQSTAPTDRDARDIYNELWGHSYDAPGQGARNQYKGVAITEDVHLRTLRFWKLLDTIPGGMMREEGAVRELAFLVEAKIDTTHRDAGTLYRKLYFYANKACPFEMQISHNIHYGSQSNAQPKEAQPVTTTKKKADPVLLMNSKKVQKAIKKADVIKATKLSSQIHDGYSKQAEVTLGGIGIGTVGYNDKLKGRNRWQSVDPESSKRFTNRNDATAHCFDLACGDTDLWLDCYENTAELVSLVDFAVDINQARSDSTRHYQCELYRDGLVVIKATLSIGGVEGDTNLLDCSLRWHRLLEQPVRVKLAELLIPMDDWAQICTGLYDALKATIKHPVLDIHEEEEGEDAESETPIDIYSDSPYDPTKAEFTKKEHTISLLLTRITEGELQLDPDFQRQAGLWSKRNSSRLIESLLLGIPLPMFIFRAMESGDWQCVDGLQRLTAIKRFVLEGAKLSGLEHLHTLRGKTYAEIGRVAQRKIMETSLSCVIIEANVPIAVTFNVFSRLNAGGVKLNPQELRHALNQGVAANMIRDLARSPEFIAATQNGIASKRMQDREVVLRYLAFSINDPSEYKGGMSQWLAMAMQQLNNLPAKKIALMEERFKWSMTVSDNLLGSDAFRIHAVPEPERRSRVNKALFEAWSCAFGRLAESQVDLLIEQRDEFKRELLDMIVTNEIYCDSVTSATSRTSAVVARHEAADQFIKAHLLKYAAMRPKRSDKGKPRKSKATKAKAKKSTKTGSGLLDKPGKGKTSKGTSEATEAPSPQAQTPTNGVSEGVYNGHPEYTLAEINKDNVRKVTRKVATGGKCTLVLPGEVRVGLHTTKKRGGISFVATDLLTSEEFLCGSKTVDLVDRLQRMA